MDNTTADAGPKPALEFAFRGNAVAAGGFLTKLKGAPVTLDPRHVTVHGESSLPTIGGISHSLVEDPELRFEDFIDYEMCETMVEGTGDDKAKTTSLRAVANKVRVTTGPSPADHVPDLRSISFRAGRLSISMRSTHPLDGQPGSFELLGEPETAGMSLVLTPVKGSPVEVPLRLVFDQTFLPPNRLEDLDQRFLTNREFFDAHAPFMKSREPLVFGKSSLPRTQQGYAACSIVTAIYRGDERIPGNVLTEKGFGKIVFGRLLGDAYGRRISLVHIQMGSDPEGVADFTGVCSSPIWI